VVVWWVEVVTQILCDRMWLYHYYCYGGDSYVTGIGSANVFWDKSLFGGLGKCEVMFQVLNLAAVVWREVGFYMCCAMMTWMNHY
jgi:hypothetical protein